MRPVFVDVNAHLMDSKMASVAPGAMLTQNLSVVALRQYEGAGWEMLTCTSSISSRLHVFQLGFKHVSHALTQGARSQGWRRKFERSSRPRLRGSRSPPAAEGLGCGTRALSRPEWAQIGLSGEKPTSPRLWASLMHELLRLSMKCAM